MIVKSYEIQKNLSNLIKYNFFLIYGENNGLKKDIKESIKILVSNDKLDIEILSLYENDVIENIDNF